MALSRRPRSARLTLVALLAVAIIGLPSPARAVTSDLFFSEYIEGSSNNKALEIFNGTGAAVNLAAGDYSVQMYFNGNSIVGLTINLTGTVADGDVYVLAHSLADPAILAQADQTSGGGWFNGDDAVALRRGTTILDVIGQIGLDPGLEWGLGLTSTMDNTLRRKAAVMAGDPNGSDAFDPAVEWRGFATDTFGGLGSHGGAEPVVVSCGGPLATDQGVAATRTVSATDADSIVVAIAITSVTPTPAPGTITLSGFVPASSVGGTATAEVTASSAVPPGSYAVVVTATNDDATPQTASCTLTVQVAVLVRIRDIQGAGHISPKNGQAVRASGVVTAKRSNGFYMQDPSPDADLATAEGIFVFTSSAPAVDVGDALSVRGRAIEFRPGGATTANLTTTEIDQVSSITVATGGNPLPAATIVGRLGRMPPLTVIENDASGSVETSGVFQPAQDGIDFWESLEGMRVSVTDAVAVGPTNDFGEIPVVSQGAAGVRTPRGGVIIRPSDFNPERVLLDDEVLIPLMPAANVGDRLGGVIGVLDYSFGNFKLQVTATPVVTAGGIAREVTATPTRRQLAVGAFNVENLDPKDPPAKLAELAGLIVHNLKAPDILAVEEIQDNNGALNDSITDASLTFQRLIAAILAAGGPTYDYRQIDPVDDQDGGEPGGNIRVGFLFRTDRHLRFVDRPGAGSTTPNEVERRGESTRLRYSPGRIDPANAAFANSRKPLAAEFRYRGEQLFLIANHFNSKGGDQPLFGRFQPPSRFTEVQRTQQAQVVADFVGQILQKNRRAKVIVLGDLNDFEFASTLAPLRKAGLRFLMDTLPAAERYTFVFEGNSQTLDHIVLSEALFKRRFRYDVVHVNAEFAHQASDHDPQVLRISLADEDEDDREDDDEEDDDEDRGGDGDDGDEPDDDDGEEGDARD